MPSAIGVGRDDRTPAGAPGGIPRLVPDEVLDRPRLRAGLEELARTSRRPPEAVRREARACLDEMAATHTRTGMDLAAALGRYMYTRAFDARIDVLPEDLARVRRLMAEKPVAFLMTHRSHVDGFMLIALFHDQGLPPLHYFGGINMKFLGLGALMKKAGAIFIRRSFHDDPVYKLVFRNYVDYLGERRYPLLWALEGTRSRTGKLMPVRYGMISYVADAYAHHDSPELVLMPISIVFDQVPEVADYDVLQTGGQKRPESASWFMQYVRRLKRPHGRIHVRFGRGVELADFLGGQPATGGVDPRTVQKIAFALAVDVNGVTPVSVNALVTYVLLAHGHEALTRGELAAELEPLREWLARRDLPTAAELAAWEPAMVDRSLKLLAANGVVEVSETGLEPVYAVAPSAGRRAAYYRNGIIHFMLPGAIAEAALAVVVETGEAALAQFRDAALHLREILKFEFYFEGREEFVRQVEADLDARAPGWRALLARGPAGTRELLAALGVILGHGTLRPFLEAYLLVAEALALVPGGESIDARALVARSHSLGRQRLLQGRVRCEESVSSSYFENAIRIAESRGLLAGGAAAAAGRQRLLAEMNLAVSATRRLGSIAASRPAARWRTAT